MIFGSTGSKMKKAMGPPRLNIRQERPPSCEMRSEEHTSELQSQSNLVCRLLLEKKKKSHRPNALLRTNVLDVVQDPVAVPALSPPTPYHDSNLTHNFSDDAAPAAVPRQYSCDVP